MQVPEIVDVQPRRARRAADSFIPVGWITNAPEAADAVLCALEGSPDLVIVAATERHRSDVVLAVADVVDDVFVSALLAVCEESSNPRQRIVLVSGPLQRRHLSRVIQAGVVCVLSHHEATPARIAGAIYTCHNGHAQLPAQLIRSLLDDIRHAQQDLLAFQNLAPGGLTTREVEVLRHISHGDDTAEVAAKLSYSERTIKKILQTMLTRLQLQNRAHAVSYAIRAGAI
ncbi:response regulator transcription factor [Lentzea sp. NPDC058450]|uniref:helix-turn-helix transcriptional regulator n=1 Tax=Lentzea sp. NPDC058450 TaxID=3346505 RepID=UPI0036552F6C